MSISHKPRSLLDELSTRVAYDPKTGDMRWGMRSPDDYGVPTCHTTQRQCDTFNVRYAGEPVGSVNRSGIVYFNYAGRQILAAHLAWGLAHGRWPVRAVIHRDADRLNLRADNLRELNVWET